jgi:hypothetical protein
MHRMWIDGSRFQFSAANDQSGSSDRAVAVQA